MWSVTLEKLSDNIILSGKMKKNNDDAKKKHAASNPKASFQKREKGILEKKQKRTANALCVKDLEEFNEEELKLLPLKDFWDATKKEWKKNVFGTFAKRNSVKMKKIFGLA